MAKRKKTKKYFRARSRKMNLIACVVDGGISLGIGLGAHFLARKIGKPEIGSFLDAGGNVGAGIFMKKPTLVACGVKGLQAIANDIVSEKIGQLDVNALDQEVQELVGSYQEGDRVAENKAEYLGAYQEGDQVEDNYNEYLGAYGDQANVY